MSRHFIIIAFLLFSYLTAISQETEPDTIASQQLQEVVIEAPKVIRKADMDVYHPSQSAIDNSKNGVQLLSNLMIPSLSVTDALGSVKAAGQDVQLRINGRQSSIDEVRALLPETIKRVEWIDNPGLRYGGAPYVLNFIVINPTVGGSLQSMVQPGLNTAWGNAFADLKLNSGYSQWEVGANYKLTNKVKTHRDYDETFTYPDGESLNRNESSLGGSVDNSFGRAWTSYSYIRPDTTVFMAQLSSNHKFSDRFRYNGLLTMSDGSDDLLLTDIHGDKGTTPALSLYLQQNFSKQHILVVDFSSSLYFGHSYSDYLERQPGAPTYLTDIHTYIKDRNQAYALEADYIMNRKNSRFTAGVSYSANRNRSTYESLGSQVFHQRQDRVYLFAEYFRRLGKWTVTAGMGVQYTDFMFRETSQGNHTWSPRPQATVTYAPNPKHNFRLNFTSWQSSPSLSETNIVPQQIDGLRWRVGNQDLNTANSYMLTLRYAFTLPRVNGSFGIRAFTSPNAITPLLYWDNDRLITTYENSRGLKNLSFFLAPQLNVIPNWLTLSGYLQYRMERMRGTGYAINHNAWSGSATLQLSHWGFNLSFHYARAQRDLWGESISWGEDLNIIDINYNWKNWQFGGGVLMPLGKYDQGSESLSKWYRNSQHMRMNMRVPFIYIGYNLQWGHQKRSAQKLIESNAEADRSTAGGR